jgi:DNA repair protein RadA/Sms
VAKKPVSQYVCSNCGAISSSWSGKCLQCGEWNTLQEQLSAATIAGSVSSGHRLQSQTVKASLAADAKRLATGIAEVDDVFGGGIVAGALHQRRRVGPSDWLASSTPGYVAL